MINPKKAVTFALLPVLLIVGLELALQVLALIVATSSRDIPEGWSTQNVRVLALGDSNTFGLYLKGKESYPSQLEDLWNRQHPEQPIEVLNLGYPGTNSYRVADNIDDIISTFEPEVVLLTIGVNDMFTAAEYTERGPGQGGAECCSHVTDLLRRHSRLYKLVHMIRQAPGKETGPPVDTSPGATTDAPLVNNREVLQWSDDPDERLQNIKAFKQGNSEDVGNSEALAETVTYGDKKIVMIAAEENTFDPDGERGFHHIQSNLAAIEQRVEKSGARLYLMSYLASASYYAAANTEIREFAKRNPQLSFIDIASQLQQSCATGYACPDVFFRDFHPRASGYAKVATMVAQRLENDQAISR